MGVLLAVLGIGAVSSAAGGQESEPSNQPAGELRIVAQHLADGRTGFAFPQHQADNSWGEWQLPRQRFFPTDAQVGRRLSSKPLTVTAEATTADASAAENTDDGAGTTQTTTQFSAVGAGGYHSCGLRSDGTVACWGENGWGQSDAPDGQFMAITAGWTYSCGLRSDATITCWGNNTYGQADTPDGQYNAITAGGSHSCGLRTDTTITCWGDNTHGQADAPDGQYNAITAGGSHSCGLRTDATITCWGSNWSGEADAPDGQYNAVTAGALHSCGLRTDTTITCWGSNWHGEADAPDGKFDAVTAGESHSCGLRTDGAITCWGDNTYGEADAPDGQYSGATAGASHSCGLRTDAVIICWGNELRQTMAPGGEFGAVSAGWTYSCGLRTDGSITCWGHNTYGQTDAPDGQYSAVTTGTSHACAIRTDGSIVCWGDNSSGETDAPDGQYSAVTANESHSCGLRGDATIVCWGHNSAGQSDAPDGRFSAVTAGGSHSCAVHSDATITCWGHNSSGETDAPEGQFSAVSAANGYSCALRADSTITCWGAGWAGRTDAPDGHFNSVTSGLQHSCGLRADATITCWGYDGGLADPPDGSFSSVTVGYRHTCGLRSDATIVCWELAPTTSAPAGVEHVTRADPNMCRPYGKQDNLTAGFPLPRWALAATGTVRVAVLFLDFPDAAATQSTRREAELSLIDAEQYLETVSYGRLDIEFVPLHRWLRAEHISDYYLGDSAIPENQALGSDVHEEAVRLADPKFDFSGYSVVMVVMPSSHFSGGTAGGSVDTQEGVVQAVVQINTFARVELSNEPIPWGRVASHELAHNFGLADYYPYSSRQELPDAIGGKIWVNSYFGPMGLVSYFLADDRDPLFRYVVHFPNVARSAEHRSTFRAGEMLAWSRWQLGWLDAAQIRCITEPEATVSLTPVATPGDGTAMAALPLSDTEMIVMESRRKIGYDADFEHRWPTGVHTTFPALATEGVLVYTVDAARTSGALPLKVAGDTGNGQVDDYPILTEGQSVTIRGYTITVQSATADTHTVTVTKAVAD